MRSGIGCMQLPLVQETREPAHPRQKMCAQRVMTGELCVVCYVSRVYLSVHRDVHAL